jgi:hypothetical protein
MREFEVYQAKIKADAENQIQSQKKELFDDFDQIIQ